MVVSLGAFMAARDLECILCQRHFTRFCADLILPENQVCDECLEELSPLTGDELRQGVSQRLDRSAPQRDRRFEERIVQAIEMFKQHRTGTSIRQEGPSK